MAVKIKRTLNPHLKVEIVELTDSFGTTHLVQQSILPLANASPEDADMVRDWHEAVIQMEAHFHQQREDSVTKAMEMLKQK